MLANKIRNFANGGGRACVFRFSLYCSDAFSFCVAVTTIYTLIHTFYPMQRTMCVCVCVCMVCGGYVDVCCVVLCYINYLCDQRHAEQVVNAYVHCGKCMVIYDLSACILTYDD